MSENARQMVQEYGRDGAALREVFFERQSQAIVELARVMALCLVRGGKILFCGNGGSAADAQHLAAEFVNRFQLERPPLPAIALTTDTSALTAISNDYGYEQVFKKQVQALGQAGDVLVGISTSGNSENVVQALKAAREKGLITICLNGQSKGLTFPYADHLVLVPDSRTPLVQEIHIALGHMLCRLVDYFLFEAVMELNPGLGRTAEGAMEPDQGA